MFDIPEGQAVLKFPEAKDRLKALDYDLARNQVDNLGRKWPYRTAPLPGSGGGSIQYYNDLKAITKKILLVEMVRSWQGL